MLCQPAVVAVHGARKGIVDAVVVVVALDLHIPAAAVAAVAATAAVYYVLERLGRSVEQRVRNPGVLVVRDPIVVDIAPRDSASVVPGQLGLEIATARTPRVLTVRDPFVYFVVGRWISLLLSIV